MINQQVPAAKLATAYCQPRKFFVIFVS